MSGLVRLTSWCRSVSVSERGVFVALGLVVLVPVLYVLDVWLLAPLVAGILDLRSAGLSVLNQDVSAVGGVPGAAWYFKHPFQVSWFWLLHLFGRPLSAPEVFHGWLVANGFLGGLCVCGYLAFRGRRSLKPERSAAYGTARFLSLSEARKFLSFGYVPGILFGAARTSFGLKPAVLRPEAPGNRNVAVFGPPGSMKSAGYIRNNMFQAVKEGASVVVTDPKGELVRDFKAWFEKRDYTVKVFNLVSLLNSDRWNPLAEVYDDISAQHFCSVVIANTAVPGRKGGDPFWDRAEMNLLKALVLYVVHELPPNNRNLGSLYSLLASGDPEEMDGTFKTLSSDHPACLPYNLFCEVSPVVRSGVIIGLGTRLEVFQNRLVRELTAQNEIDLELPGRERCAYFCVTSDTDGTFNFLASLFFSFLFIKLTRLADRQRDGRLAVPVNFLLDEFCNISGIPDFTKKISTMRSRRIACSVIFQNIPQLIQTYPDRAWEIILGDCDYWLVLGGREKTSAGYISDVLGVSTIEVESDTRPKGLEGVLNPWDGRITTSLQKRALMDLAEVMKLEEDECILRLMNGQVVKLEKLHYTRYPWAEELEPRHVSEYLPRWARSFLEYEAARGGVSVGDAYLRAVEGVEQLRGSVPERSGREAVGGAAAGSPASGAAGSVPGGQLLEEDFWRE